MTFCNSSPSTRPKTLMELLLAKKIEAASAEGSALGRRLLRTESMDSVSSIGSSCTSSMYGENVCRCDDCLLGIVDLYVIQPKERASLKKKVTELKRKTFTIVFAIFSFVAFTFKEITFYLGNLPENLNQLQPV